MAYIVIEGIDGIGKTTLQRRLVDRIISGGGSALTIHDTRGTPASAIMYELVTDSGRHLLPETKLDLFNAARRETLRVVKQQLDRGNHCINDRSWYSSVAYQGYGEGMDPDYVYQKASEAAWLKADLTIVLDGEVDLAAERTRLRGAKVSWFEQQGAAFFERTRSGFLELAKRDGLPIIDATASKSVVTEQAWVLIEPFLA